MKNINYTALFTVDGSEWCIGFPGKTINDVSNKLTTQKSKEYYDYPIETIIKINKDVKENLNIDNKRIVDCPIEILIELPSYDYDILIKKEDIIGKTIKTLRKTLPNISNLLSDIEEFGEEKLL